MSARSCPGCEREFRKGTLVFLLDPVTGNTKCRRVCATCASRGIVVVAPRQTPIVRKVKSKGRELFEDLDGIRRKLTTLGKLSRSSYERENDGGDPTIAALMQGRAEGYEGALELLSGRTT